MDKPKNENKQNRSMFLYTALIFAVALILIILAFFGQTNLTNLRRSADQANAPATAIETAEATELTVTEAPDELARLGNAVSALEAENSSLKDELEVYASLIRASARISENNAEEAAAELEKVNYDTLDTEQKMLYEQTNKKIEEKINKGEEQ